MADEHGYEHKAVIYYSAASAEKIDQLDHAILDAAATALGCTDDPDHVCPHFAGAATRPVRGSRRWAIRFALIDLWAAIRHGELA